MPVLSALRRSLCFQGEGTEAACEKNVGLSHTVASGSPATSRSPARHWLEPGDLRLGCIDRGIKPGDSAADKDQMRDYDGAFDVPVEDDAECGWDPAFALFVLRHARCEASLIEARIGERLLFAWCPCCAVLETFGSSGE